MLCVYVCLGAGSIFFQNGLGKRGQRASNNRCGVTYSLSTGVWKAECVAQSHSSSVYMRTSIAEEMV